MSCKEDLMRDLCEALDEYYSLRDVSVELRWYHGGQVIALEGVAMKYFGLSFREVMDLEKAAKEKYAKARGE